MTASETWRRGHPWGALYDFVVERERLGRVLWLSALGTDLRLLHATADEIGDLPDGSAVLDIPCGGGVALRGLRPDQDVRYVAADIAPDMLARTRRRAERLGLTRVETVAADVEALDFADASFDLCVSLTGLHCVPRPAAAVAEIARVLRPGGMLRGSALLNDTGLLHAPMRTLGRLSGLLGPSGTTTDLRGWLADAGLRDAQLRASGGLVYFSARRAG